MPFGASRKLPPAHEPDVARPGNLNGYHTVSMILAHYSGPGVYAACRLPLNPALPEGESMTRLHQCVQFFTSLTRREDAQDLLEYALLTALIAQRVVITY